MMLQVVGMRLAMTLDERTTNKLVQSAGAYGSKKPQIVSLNSRPAALTE